jgi:VanZ family protein
MYNLRRLQYWIPVFLWMGFIFWMSTGTFSSENTSSIILPIIKLITDSISVEKANLIQGLIRKLGHVGEYFVLGFFLFRAFCAESKKNLTWRCAFYSILVVMLYAASDEFHQFFVSSRTASVVDVGIDTLGGILAQCISLLGWFTLHKDRGELLK